MRPTTYLLLKWIAVFLFVHTAQVSPCLFQCSGDTVFLCKVPGLACIILNTVSQCLIMNCTQSVIVCLFTFLLSLGTANFRQTGAVSGPPRQPGLSRSCRLVIRQGSQVHEGESIKKKLEDVTCHFGTFSFLDGSLSVLFLSTILFGGGL